MNIFSPMKWLAVFCTFVLAPVLSASGSDTATALKEFDAYLDQTAIQLGDSPFAAVVSKGGKIIYERYYDGQGTLGRPVDAQSRWQVYSITKSFASATILTLVKDGIIALDDPVSKYLPAFKEHGGGAFDRRAVTIRHLMSHTSGAAFGGKKTPEFLPPSFENIDIITGPGKDFKYSGLGMLILERTIEAATGRDFDVLVNEIIIKPLGLKSTGYVYPGTATARIMPLKKNIYYYSLSGKRAGAGLFTSARDLNKFGQFWLSPESKFSPSLRKEAWTYHGTRGNDNGHYGLMWWLFEDDGGYVMSGKDNKINAVVPETNVVISVIRYPQAKAAEGYKFTADKRAMVLFGKRL